VTVARTARRRRLQAVMGYRHMAHIGRGNNNRPYYSKMDAGVSQRREAQKREKQLMMQLRKGASRRK
jgi:hypothetical protein